MSGSDPIVALIIGGSGSSGNNINLIVDPGLPTEYHLAIDMGLSPQRLHSRLAWRGILGPNFDVVFYTHAHLDHCMFGDSHWYHQGLGRSGRYFDNYIPPRFLEHPTQAVDKFKRIWSDHIITVKPGVWIETGPIRVLPLQVPHDRLLKTMAYLIKGPGMTLAYATDMCLVSDDLVDYFREADALVMEFNFDPERLDECDEYPDWLKDRIRNHAHISNDAAGDVLRKLNSGPGSKVKLVSAFHLSGMTNTPLMAYRAMVDGWNAGEGVTEKPKFYVARKYPASPVFMFSPAAGLRAYPTIFDSPERRARMEYLRKHLAPASV